MTDDTDICGAECADGSPCQRQPDGDGDRCYMHDDVHGHSEEMYDPEAVAEAIREAQGNLTEAARALGCHRSTLYNYCERYESCRAARDESRNELVDKAHDVYHEILEDDDASDSDRLRAADQVTDKYDPNTEPDKRELSHEHDLDEDPMEALERIMTGDG